MRSLEAAPISWRLSGLTTTSYIRVPFGRYSNPVTEADWEGTGVDPDIKVAATSALDEALQRAREQSLKA